MRLFRKLVSNLNPKLVTGLKILRIFNSFRVFNPLTPSKTNNLIGKKLLSKQPLNYYNRLALTIITNFKSKVGNNNLKWLFSFAKIVKTKNHTQTKLIHSLISKPFYKKLYKKPVFIRNINIQQKTNYQYLMVKLVTSLKRNTRQMHRFITLMSNPTNLNLIPKHRLNTRNTAYYTLLKFFFIKNLSIHAAASEHTKTTMIQKLLSQESRYWLFDYSSLVSLQKSYRCIICNIAQTCNLYRPFWTKSIITRLADASFLLNKKKNITKNPLIFKLLFNFKKHYLHLTLFGSKDEVFFSINTSLFLKFIGYKKSLKKSYSLKLLLIKYLRKLLIVSNLKNFYLHIKNTSSQLNKFIRLLQKPFNHTFTNPLTGEIVGEETDRASITRFNFPYIIFLQNRPYGFMKTKKTGRLKRKIRRRLIKLNRIID